MTTREAAEKFGVTRAQMDRWIFLGIINPDKDARGALIITDGHLKRLKELGYPKLIGRPRTKRPEARIRG